MDLQELLRLTPHAIGVTATFSAAHHNPKYGGLHGHSYEVRAWFADGDAGTLKTALERVVAEFDHKRLPDRLARAEAVGVLIMAALGCRGVEINRPLEGLYISVGVCG